MTSIEVIDEERVSEGECQNFNVADYSKKIFRMFSGDTEKVKLKFDNSLLIGLERKLRFKKCIKVLS